MEQIQANNDSKLIPLSRGLFALVDAEDFQRLSRHKWHANPSSTGDFYARTTVYNDDGSRVQLYMHREVMGISSGDCREVDHRNPSETLDNRKSNLRIASNLENSRNCRSKRRRKPGGENLPKGAYFATDKNKWTAQVRTGGRVVQCGYFSTPEEAGSAYAETVRAHHGEFACTRNV
jgi:hypothetical protein